MPVETVVALARAVQRTSTQPESVLCVSTPGREQNVKERKTQMDTHREDPRQVSAAELDEYLDQLVRAGQDDTPEFHKAFKIWEKNQ